MKGLEASRVRWIPLFAFLLLACSSAPVLADSPAEQPPESPAQAESEPVPLPDSQDVMEGIEAAELEEEERERELESPKSELEREESRDAFGDLSSATAQELLLAAFPEQLEALNDDPARFLSDAKILQPLGEEAATVSNEGDTSLLEAGMPVRTEDEEGKLSKVDLTLVVTEGGFEPANPLISLSIPGSSQEAVTVGDEGVGITALGEDAAAERLGDQNIYYPDVDTDTDLLVSPTSSGVELFDQLRSPESPETLHFHIDLPEGSELRPDGNGGAEVVKGEEAIASIPFPSAVDAQGTRVPVELQVEGNTIALHVAHREVDLMYPILVDPILEDWVNSNTNWVNGNNLQALTNGAWKGTSEPFDQMWLQTTCFDSSACWGSSRGLYVRAPGRNYGAEAHAHWAYAAPNMGSYVSKAWLIPFWRNDHNCSQSQYSQPHDYDGFWGDGQWTVPPQVNQAINVGSVAVESWGRSFVFGLSSGNGVNIPCNRDLFVGGAAIWLDDWEAPYLNSVSGIPTGWIKKDATQRTINVSAGDGGLGVQQVRMFGVGTSEWKWNQPGCSGTYENRCPTSASGQITFETGGFPYEGEVKFSVQALDPTGKGSNSQGYSMLIDGTSPTVNLQGQLAEATKEEGTEEKTQGLTANDRLKLPTYNLKIEAKDGTQGKLNDKSDWVLRSGIKEIKVYLDGKATPEETKTQSCPEGSCPMTMNYALKLPGLSAGTHALKIVVIDQAGNETKPERKIEFQYFPATGMKEEYVLQHIPLPDGKDHSGEEESHGPEIAVNVMNGNLVYHERDVDVEGRGTNLELERYYNSQLPTENDTQWGHGWNVAQAPELKPQQGESPPQNATMQASGAITGSVSIPASQGQQTFNSQLHAAINKTAGGSYEAAYENRGQVSVFNASGRIEETRYPSGGVPAGESKPAPLAPTYIASRGTYGTGDGQFKVPADVAIDSAGNAWVVDKGNNRIEKFDSEGKFVSKFGTEGTGDGQFKAPSALALDAKGNIWVVDHGNNRVEEFSPEGKFLFKFGSYGSSKGQLNGPEGIAIGAKGSIWVSDTSRVQRFSEKGEAIEVLATKGSGMGQIGEPSALDADSAGNVWIADWGNNRVEVFTEAGGFVRQFGASGTADGQFKHPDAIDVDGKGNVWVGDQEGNRVEEFSQSGQYVAKFGVKGSGEGQFSFTAPMGITTDGKGGIWIADVSNNRVQKWQIPNYVPGYTDSFDGSGTEGGQFNHPGGVAIDSKGYLWVVDRNNNRIKEFDPSGEYIAQFGSTGSGNGQLSGPSGVAIDSEGNLWVTDTGNNRVEKFNQKGEYLTKFGSTGSGNGQFKEPAGIAVEPSSGAIFVVDRGNNRIERFEKTGAYVGQKGSYGSEDAHFVEPSGVAIGGPSGESAYTFFVTDSGNNRVQRFTPPGGFLGKFGSAGSAAGQFNRPEAIDVDSSGNVWVGDRNNSRVEEFTESGESISQFGSAGSGAGQFSFSYPMGIVTDALEHVWVTDTDHNRIERFFGQSQAPSVFQNTALKYTYSGINLTKLTLSDPAGTSNPSLNVNVAGGLVGSVQGEAAGTTTYSYASGKLTAVQGTQGKAEYGYDSSKRLTSIKLPNGTTASMEYDTLSRATAVTVDPAGAEGAKTTHFWYGTEPRETKVWGGGNPEITYSIGEDGSVFKWSYAEVPPAIDSISGSLWASRNSTTPIENKDHTLFVIGKSPHEIGSIQILVNGNGVAAEKTCEDNSKPPAHNCEEVKLEWITNAAEHAAGQLNLEAVVTDFLGHSTAERFFVTIPQQPPPDPEAPVKPSFSKIKQFREEFGLDLNHSQTEEQRNLLILELLYEWERQDPVAVISTEKWGVPMRTQEVDEMEYRERYIAQAATLIPQWAESHASTTYAGYYVDHRAGGIIHVGFTANQAALVVQLKAEAGLLAPDRVEVFPTQPSRPLGGLQSLQGSVADATAAVSSPSQIFSVDLDIEHNGVKVATSEVSQASAYLNQVFGAQAGLSAYFQAGAPDQLAGRYQTRKPFLAGEEINNVEHSCTAGFGGWSRVGTKPTGESIKRRYVLTAGHCFPLTETNSAGIVYRASAPKDGKWVQIGKVERQGFLGVTNSFETDSEAVWLEQPDLVPGWVYECCGGRAAMRPTGIAYPRVGQVVCHSGVKSNAVLCGPILGEASPGRTKNVHTGQLSGQEWLLHVGAGGAEGDSGSPVWERDTGAAVGLVIGGGSTGLLVEPLMRPPNAPASQVAGILSDQHISPAGHPLNLQFGSPGE
jgi:YD repeat-containing protein